MNKKIISIILATATLASAASAANLYEYVNGNAEMQPFTGISENVNSTTGIYEHNAVVTPTLAAQVKKSSTGTYSDTATLNSTSDTADCMVKLDMTTVKNQFTNLCTITEKALEMSTPAVSTGPAVTTAPGTTPAPAMTEAEKAAYIAQLKNQFNGSNVTGTFSVNIKYSSKLTVDPSTITLKQGSGTPAIFSLASASTPTLNNGVNECTVTFNVTGNPTVASLKADLSQLDDLYVEMTGIALPSGLVSGEQLSVTAQLAAPSYIELTDSTTPDVAANADKAYGKLNFTSNASTATLTYVPSYTPSTPGTSGGKRPSTTLPTTAPVIKATADGKTVTAPVYANSGKYFLNVDRISVPGKENFAFEGWYTDPYFSNHVSGTIQVDEDMNLYARYINLKAPEQLISEDHMAYISGYPDGTIQPKANITREEVVSAFYRLLKPEFKATIETETNSFPDVAADRWSNKAISTMANGGFIVGDANGNFNPSSPITRAEFVAIANKFIGSNIIVPDTNQFSDISGHWAEKAILAAANGAYWISGYSDGTFRPDNYITRAEAMTIINKMLVRYGDTTAENVKTWPDVWAADWYYSQVIEATTDNVYERMGNGWQEKWISPEAPKAEEDQPETSADDKTELEPAADEANDGEDAVTEGTDSTTDNTEENTENTSDAVGDGDSAAADSAEEMTEPEK